MEPRFSLKSEILVDFEPEILTPNLLSEEISMGPKFFQNRKVWWFSFILHFESMPQPQNLQISCRSFGVMASIQGAK